MPRTEADWAALVGALALPEDGCSITDLVEHVAHYRGRPIRLEPLASGVAYTGSVADRGDHFLLNYTRDGGPTLQAWAVCHELSHVLLKHRPDRDEDGTPVQDPTGGQLQILGEYGTAAMMLCRTGAASEAEDDAEILAWLLLERAGRRSGSRGGALASVLAPRRRRR